MFLSGKGSVISSGHFNTKNNKKMSVLNVQVNGEIHKFLGSGKVPKISFWWYDWIFVIAQKQKGLEYLFILQKAEEIKEVTEK